MPKLKVEDLEKIREVGRASVSLRRGAGRARVTVHMDECGIAAGARDIVKSLLREMERREVVDVVVSISGCAGHCDLEPMATVEVAGQDPVIYVELTPEKMGTIFEEHLLGGNVVRSYTLPVDREKASQD